MRDVDKERESLVMFIMAVAVATAAGVLLLSFLVTIFQIQGKRRYFHKIKGDILVRLCSHWSSSIKAVL